jgi:hypothetical protein
LLIRLRQIFELVNAFVAVRHAEDVQENVEGRHDPRKNAVAQKIFVEKLSIDRLIPGCIVNAAKRVE